MAGIIDMGVIANGDRPGVATGGAVLRQKARAESGLLRGASKFCNSHKHRVSAPACCC